LDQKHSIMGRKIITHKTTLVYNGIKFDSDEEVFVAMWLQELQDAGFVKRWSRAELPYHMTAGLKRNYIKETQLKTKLKRETRTQTLLRPSEYTPDFIVNFTEEGKQLFVCSLEPENIFIPNMLFYKNTPGVILEVKPSFDQNNMERLFVLNQKFLWEKEKIFVNLVEPVALFEKTFIPLAAIPYFQYKVVTKKLIAKGKKKGDWKLNFEPRTLKQYLDA